MEQPLAVNAENSRAKVQNVGGDSSASLPSKLDLSKFYCFFFVPGLSSVKASSALNGNWRTDCCPVLLKVMSTRRFCASVTSFKFFRILSFCS